MEQNQTQDYDLARQLLDSTSDDLTTSQIATYIAHSQMRCQTFCDNKIRHDLEEKHEMHRDLTNESLIALEK
jgi:hypothetical protein